MDEHQQIRFNALLVRWLQWVQAVVRVPDTQMVDLDALIAGLPRAHRVALIIRARNLCGPAVWHSKRLGPDDIEQAQASLKALLEPDHRRWYGPRLIKVNQAGRRVGESNPKADLSDHEVDLLRQLREETDDQGRPRYTLQWLADKFGVPVSTVADICRRRRRTQQAAKVKVE